MRQSIRSAPSARPLRALTYLKVVANLANRLHLQVPDDISVRLNTKKHAAIDVTNGDIGHRILVARSTDSWQPLA